MAAPTLKQIVEHSGWSQKYIIVDYSTKVEDYPEPIYDDDVWRNYNWLMDKQVKSLIAQDKGVIAVFFPQGTINKEKES